MKGHSGKPYLEVVDEPRMMRGEGAPRSTVFGVLGRTKESPKMKSLGGLVHETASGRIPKGEIIHAPRRMHTERNITGPPGKTHIPGSHHGMVPYPGKYMSDKGAEL